MFVPIDKFRGDFKAIETCCVSLIYYTYVTKKYTVCTHV